jgi:hypothetical protein
MKKPRLIFIGTLLLLSSMNISAQVETISYTKETQKQAPKISLDQARADYNQAKENLMKARTGTRSSLSIAQKELSDKKNQLLFLLESAINTETNETVKSELINELNQIKSIN